jgi:hypothetical protein
VFGERAVVGDNRHVESELEGERARIAKSAPRHERNAHPRRTRFANGRAVARRQLAERVEQRSVEIERK